MIEPQVLSWSVVIFILLTPLLLAAMAGMDDDD